MTSFTANSLTRSLLSDILAIVTSTVRPKAAIAVAKVLSTKVAIEFTSKIFEVIGTRAAATRLGFDRFWRNVRTHVLHDPVFYKFYEVGNWGLNQQSLTFTLYT